MLVRVRIGDIVGNEWLEEFEVKSFETSEKEIKQVIERFNATLKPGERPRKFIEIIDTKCDLQLLKSYLEKLLLKLGYENKNAYGNRGVKRNFLKWKKIILSFLSLRRPTKLSYKNLYETLVKIPKDFKDKDILVYVKSKIK